MSHTKLSLIDQPVVQSNLSYLIPICIVATLAGFLFGYDTGVNSGAIEPLTAKFHLTDFMKGWASGCVLIGCAVGVLLVGPLTDRYGRKMAMLLDSIIFLLAAIGTAIPNDIWTFIAFRFLGGIGIGIASISTPMYIAEVTPKHLRGRMVAVNQIAIVCGIAATSFINYLIAQHGDQTWLINTGWRWMFAMGIVPSFLFVILRLFMPESPRWLIEKNREDEATLIMTKVAGPDYARTEAAQIKAALAEENGTWGEVFSAKLRKPLLIGIALAILQQITGINVFMYFGATIFKNLSNSTGVDAGLLQQFIINGSGVLFTIIAIATVDKWGRKPLMLIGSAGMGVALFVMGAVAQKGTNAETASSSMLLFIILYFACFSLSVGPIVWVLLSEIYPTAIRGRALGLATFFLWMSDFAVTQTYPLMTAPGSWFVRNLNHAFPFYVYAGFCVVLIIVMAIFVPETKGKSLEEIEHHWLKK